MMSMLTTMLLCNVMVIDDVVVVNSDCDDVHMVVSDVVVVGASLCLGDDVCVCVAIVLIEIGGVSDDSGSDDWCC